jgi:hypothetical protein
MRATLKTPRAGFVMKSITAVSATCLALGIAACSTQAPPPPPPSDQQPIQASPSTPVDREPVPGLDAPKDKDGKKD